MCGIAGVVLERGTGGEFDEKAQRSALERLRHRGPDATGEYQGNWVWLGHTRLSILDLSPAGRQPMRSADGRFVITYNGEVYNYRNLSRTLGIEHLRSTTDTEVILESFALSGEEVFRRLNGIFAFAIHDRRKNAVWLVRDRLGVKPLYYYQDGSRFLFASEIQALLTLIGSTPSCDLANLHEWFYYGNTLGGRTLFRGIRQVLPGHALRIDIDSWVTADRCYWSLQEEIHSSEPIEGSTAEIVCRTRELLGNAVRRQLVSDVPVGVFLSGGIDSSAITAFASRYYGAKISTYAAGFDDPYGVDERGTARRVASHFGTAHHELFIEGRDLAPVVEELIDRHGGPFSDAANIPLYLMAEQLSGRIKVVLQGDGGDEVFGGYRRYATLRYRGLLHSLAGLGEIAGYFLPESFLKRRIRRYINIYRQKELAPTVALLLTQEGLERDLLSVFNESCRDVLASTDPTERYREVQEKFASLDICQQMSMIDLSIILPDTYLEKVDRATMAHGLEARVPFLDNELVNYVVALPGKSKMPLGRKKWLLKQALRGIVPDHVLDAPKTGFGVPYHHWLSGSLREHFYGHLTTFQRRVPGIVFERVINDWFRDAERGRRDRSSRLWKLYNLLIWSNRFGVGFDV